jgi:N6-L-threonylcarbamoyladenine synthase
MVRLVAQQQRQADGAGTALPVADLAASFEQVVAEVLVERSCRCAKDQGLKTLVLVGGVAANRRLRSLLEARCQSLGLEWRAAPLAYCTDNAAMIGVAAEQRLLAGGQSAIELAVAPRWPLENALALYDRQNPF